MEIQFGTDGWRGRTADTVTFAAMRQLATATAGFLAAQGPARELALGYDTRFLSLGFAETVAEVFAAHGFTVHLSDRPCPTPAISLAAQAPGRAAAVMITAGQNPAADNGFKLITPAGAAAPHAWTAPIAAAIGAPTAPAGGGQIVKADFWAGYEARLAAQVDLERLLGEDVSVIVDPMHGAASGLLHRLLPGRAVEIRWERDPEFGGGQPEPIAANLRQLRRLVQAKWAPVKVGLAFDGAGDRLGVVRGDGAYVDSHQVMALLLRHLVETRGMSGEVVVTVEDSQLLRRLAAHYDLPVRETPIGFDQVTARMLATDVLIGGGADGIGIRGHVPDRDGPLAALLLLEMLAERRQDLGVLLAEIEAMVGWRHHYACRDLPHADPDRVVAATAAHPPARIAGMVLERTQTTDGIKLHFTDGSWLLLRGSGTEPVLHLSADARDDAAVEALLDWAVRASAA